MAASATKAATQTRSLAKKQAELEDDVHGALHDRIARLRHELASLTEAVQDFSLNTYDGALDVVDGVRHQAARAGRQVGRQANAAGHVVKENPVPFVFLAVIALFSAIVLQRHD
jgi:uncharacterized protein YoxC